MSRWSAHFCFHFTTVASVALCLVASFHLIYELRFVVPFRHIVSTSRSRWDEPTYIPRGCAEKADITTSDMSDLILDSNDARDTQVVLKHGAGILPGLLSSHTAARLREVVMRKNLAQRKSEQFFVIQSDHRWSLRTGLIDPIHDPAGIFPSTLSEIASHPSLTRLLEDVLGPDPALVEMSAITSEYGAEAQHWHSDTQPSKSAMMFGRTYVDLYTVFVQLQNTTAGMGATMICPGTHMCAKFSNDLCDERGFQIGPVGAGDAIVYNSELGHRGMGHIDPKAEERVMLLLSFASSPRGNDPRLLPMGATYALRWDMWGQTLTSLRRMKVEEWNGWHSLGWRTNRIGGIGGGEQGTSARGWPYVLTAMMNCSEREDRECAYVDWSKVMTVRLVMIALEAVLLLLYCKLLSWSDSPNDASAPMAKPQQKTKRAERNGRKVTIVTTTTIIRSSGGARSSYKESETKLAHNGSANGRASSAIVTKRERVAFHGTLAVLSLAASLAFCWNLDLGQDSSAHPSLPNGGAISPPEPSSESSSDDDQPVQRSESSRKLTNNDVFFLDGDEYDDDEDDGSDDDLSFERLYRHFDIFFLDGAGDDLNNFAPLQRHKMRYHSGNRVLHAVVEDYRPDIGEGTSEITEETVASVLKDKRLANRKFFWQRGGKKAWTEMSKDAVKKLIRRMLKGSTPEEWPKQRLVTYAADASDPLAESKIGAPDL